MPYDPAIQHRRSIRMRGWHYDRGAYFVTICTHRDAGAIFSGPSAEIVASVWESIPARFPGVSVGGIPARAAAAPGDSVGAGLAPAPLMGNHEGCPYYAIMPDHFHGMIWMGDSGRELGDIIGAFKSLVAHEFIAEIKAGKLPPFPGKIWQRNYYERIIRSARDAAAIAGYIRANPWRIPVDIGGAPVGSGESPAPLRAIGNPQLLERRKIGVLCSRDCPADAADRARSRFRAMAEGGAGHPEGNHEGCPYAIVSGFHSPVEKECLAALLRGKAAIIACLPRAIEHWRLPAEWLAALEQNRMLVISPFRNDAVTRAAALDRNRLVLHFADELYIPFAHPYGGLAALLREQKGE